MTDAVAMMPARAAAPARPTVRCGRCGHVIFDGEVVKSRVILVDTPTVRAKCRCKAWVSVPLVYAP